MATVTATPSAPVAKGPIRIQDRVLVVNKGSMYANQEGVVTKITNGHYRVRFNGEGKSFAKKDIRRISNQNGRKRKAMTNVEKQAEKRRNSSQCSLLSMLSRK